MYRSELASVSASSDLYPRQPPDCGREEYSILWPRFRPGGPFPVPPVDSLGSVTSHTKLVKAIGQSSEVGGPPESLPAAALRILVPTGPTYANSVCDVLRRRVVTSDGFWPVKKTPRLGRSFLGCRGTRPPESARAWRRLYMQGPVPGTVVVPSSTASSRRWRPEPQ